MTISCWKGIKQFGLKLKFVSNFHGLNVPEDGVRFEPFTMISPDSLLFIRTNII